MKKLALALSTVAAFTGSAIAADLPARPYTKAAPVAYVAPPSWTGCYIGGGGGYGMWNRESTLFSNSSGSLLAVAATDTAGGRGWFGTVQGGCDYQFGMGAQQFVIGLDAAYDFTGFNGHTTVPFFGEPFIGDVKEKNAWSVGGRVGWVVFPQLLTYFSAGYTQAHFNTANFVNFNDPGDVFTIASRNRSGWYLGAGDEYALNFMPGLFWKTEYRVSEFNKNTSAIFENGVLNPTFAIQSKTWVQTIRSELVYRFNWGGPVVAKY